MRGLSKMVENKSENHKTAQAKPKTEEGQKAEGEHKAAERKARGNNGAKRDMHFEMKMVEKDIYPDGATDEQKAAFDKSTRCDPLHHDTAAVHQRSYIHTIKSEGSLISAKAPLTPLQNSSFDASFIAGIAQLRYLYSMPVERIVNYFSENGFNLDKQTAHGLLKKTASLFENQHKAMRNAVKEDGYIWVILAAHLGLTFFFYDNGSRSEEVILRQLENYYTDLFNSPSGIEKT